MTRDDGITPAMPTTERVYVALDLETTGLVPESDEIIEIAAIKFRNGRDIDVFQSLVNPYRPIPYNICRLCDISQTEIDAAPPFAAVVSDLTSFLEGCSPVGHNVPFDLKFLARKGIHLPGQFYDTYELAKLLLPQLTERSLSAVASHLGIPHPSAHRALADATVARQVFEALLGRLHEIDPRTLRELVRLTANTPWWVGQLLSEIAEARGVASSAGQVDLPSLLVGQLADMPARQSTPAPENSPVDVDRLSSLLGADGPFAREFPRYEHRPEQIAMSRGVAEALNNGQHLLVEAGPGTGKSMAYLLPAAAFASQNDVPVIVSTHTINLQEQLMHKDIPDLMRVIGPEIGNIKVAQIKGRTNYLCLRRWETVCQGDNVEKEVVQLLARVQVWLPTTQTGDSAEVNLDGFELRFWPRIAAQGYDCLGKHCRYYQQDLCFLHRARHAAGEAHLIVTNHALLLSEAVAGARILPEYHYLIVDEAHHLEDVATGQFGSELREEDILNHLDQVELRADSRKTGFLPHLGSSLGAADIETAKKNELRDLLKSASSSVVRARSQVTEFFNSLGHLFWNHGQGQGEHDLHLRITGAMRAQPAWSDAEISCENLDVALDDVGKSLARIRRAIEGSPLEEELESRALSLLNTNDNLRQRLTAFVFEAEENSIHWLTLGRRSNTIGLHSTPLHVGPVLQKLFYPQRKSMILTSATLSIAGNFSYIKQRLGIDGAREMQLGSPFDYPNSALIYLASDIPEPGQPGYQDAVARALISICRAAGGRCLVLFTSNAALRTARTAIHSELQKDDILTLGQGIDGPPRKLLASLRSNPRTVILGSGSFWEGVDIVGDALSVLVIVRLPFAVPTDPVFAARADTFDDPFNEYTLPKTAFRFKQGFGRLIRSKTDRGVMVVLDSRLTARNYGQVFLKSLPPCRIEKGPARDLSSVVKGWLQKNETET